MVGHRVLFAFQREFFVNVTSSFLTSEEESGRGFAYYVWVRGNTLAFPSLRGMTVPQSIKKGPKNQIGFQIPPHLPFPKGGEELILFCACLRQADLFRILIYDLPQRVSYVRNILEGDEEADSLARNTRVETSGSDFFLFLITSH